MNKLLAFALGMILLGCGSDDSRRDETPLEFTSSPGLQVTEGRPYQYEILYTHPADELPQLSSVLPSWLTLNGRLLSGTPGPQDAGTHRVELTLTSSDGTKTELQSFDIVVSAEDSEPEGNVTISGDVEEGATLTASNDLADEDGIGTITYQWLADGVAINGETESTLVLTQEQVGAAISVTASYTDDQGFDHEVTSDATGAVIAAAPVGNSIQAIDTNGAITAVLTKEGTVQVWGDNTYGTLGHLPGTNGDTDTGASYYNPEATTISGLTNVTSIAVGYSFLLALKDDGSVWAWGRNENGELGHVPGSNSDVTTEDYYTGFFADYDGDGFEYFNTTPVQVGSLTNVTAIAASNANGYALKSDGTVWAWGDNTFSLDSFGKLGSGDNTSGQSGSPVQVRNSDDTGNLENIVSIFASDFGSAFATESDGTVWAWGANNSNQLGLNDNTDRTLPVEHPSLTDVTYVEVSGQLGAARLLDGTVSYWGDSTATSISTITFSPTDSGLTNVTELSVESNGLIALKADGTAQSVGANLLGELGNGSTGNIATPTAIMASERFVHVAKGEFFTAAILEDGTVKTWGNNASGQLGHAPTTNGDVQPVQDGDVYNLGGVVVDGITANTIAAPKDLEATVGADLILSWTDVIGADSYNVYWSTSADVNLSNGTKIAGATNGAALQTLTSGKRYHLIVTAVDASGNESVGSLELAVDFPTP